METTRILDPSQVRDCVARQHVQLRILFVEVEHACTGALDGGRADPRPLVLTLTRAVCDHLSFEDHLLLPTLRALDGRRPGRAARVAADHAGQRAELAALHQLARRGSAIDTARSALALLGELRLDMDAEERDLLSPELLSDAPVTVAQSG
jgi:hypothetical protein